MSNNTLIAKNTFFLYIRSVFLMFLNLYASRITLKVLGVEDYGIYQLVGGVVGMFSMLSGTLSSASQRFITYALGEQDKEKLKSVFSSCLTLHFILGLLVVILLEVLGIWFLNNKLNIPIDRLYVARLVMQFSIATFFINVISVPFNACIVAHEKMNAFALISILDGILKLLCVLVLKYLNYDHLFLYSLFLFIISLFIRLIYSTYSRHSFEEAKEFTFKVDRAQFKDMFSFAGWNLFGQGSMVLRNQGVDILLNIFFGVSVNGAKGISNQVQGAIHSFVSNFTTAIKPQLTKSVAIRDLQRTYSLLFHGTRLSFFLMMLFIIPLSICTEEVMALWLGEVPDFAVNMVRVSLIYLQSNTLSRLLIDTILAYGSIRNFQVISGGTKLLAFPVSWVVLKYGGSPLTGIWVNIVFDFICRFEELFFVREKSSYDIKNHLIRVDLSCWGVFLIALICSSLLNRVSPHYLISIMLSGIISLMTVWILGLESHEKKMVKKQIIRIIKR